MERFFLRRRIGVLCCIVGILTILSAIAYYYLEPDSEAASSEKAEQRVLIIDAGHGGEDGGAVAADGTQEADLNLAISNRLNAMSALCGTETMMTRDEAKIEYPADAETIAARKAADQKNRVDKINGVNGGVLISIHQNWYPTAAPHGAQVLFAKDPVSEAFGKLLHENLVKQLDPGNRRVAAPISDDIYLMRNAACPAVLVECGFLSNPEEMALLQDDSYQLKLSMVMLHTYLQYFQTGWNQ